MNEKSREKITTRKKCVHADNKKNEKLKIHTKKNYMNAHNYFPLLKNQSTLRCAQSIQSHSQKGSFKLLYAIRKTIAHRVYETIYIEIGTFAVHFPTICTYERAVNFASLTKIQIFQRCINVNTLQKLRVFNHRRRRRAKARI